MGNLDVRSFAITAAGTLFVGAAVGGSAAPPPVFRSDDDGHTWVRADNGIVNHTVEAMTVDSVWAVYAANHYGVYRSTDRGANWTNIGGPSGGRSLVFNSQGDLFLASWGQGLVFVRRDRGRTMHIGRLYGYRPEDPAQQKGHEQQTIRTNSNIPSRCPPLRRSFTRCFA